MNKKVVLITGGSTGIGLEAALQLMHKGACVYAGSRRGSENRSDAVSGGKIISVQMDVNNEENILDVIGFILKNHHRLDVVICNAGNGIAGAVEDTTTEEVKYQFETNFFGAVKTIQVCLPVFRTQGSGKIMVTSSMAAIVPIPFQAFYSAGKSALSSFVQAMSMEVKPFGIQCCVVLPGDTKTDFTSSRKFTVKSQTGNSPYLVKMKQAVGKMEKDELNGMMPSFIASAMVRQIMRKRMKPTVVPGLQYKLISGVFFLIPVRLRLWIIGLIY